MNCLICANQCEDKLCNKCNKFYLYDKEFKFIRRKKHFFESISSANKDTTNELLLYLNICKIYEKKNVFRNVHPLWAMSTKHVLLEYDIVIPKENLLIEYDGIQHFKYPNFFHKTKKDFLNQKYRDELKNKLAKDNNWLLIRFNYNEQIDDINVRRKLNVYS